MTAGEGIRGCPPLRRLRMLWGLLGAIVVAIFSGCAGWTTGVPGPGKISPAFDPDTDHHCSVEPSIQGSPEEVRAGFQQVIYRLRGYVRDESGQARYYRPEERGVAFARILQAQRVLGLLEPAARLLEAAEEAPELRDSESLTTLRCAVEEITDRTADERDDYDVAGLTLRSLNVLWVGVDRVQRAMLDAGLMGPLVGATVGGQAD